jgi:hypothetical protein
VAVAERGEVADPLPLPGHPHRVGMDVRIGGQEDAAVDDGLGHQDAVERIAVERRELGDLEGGILRACEGIAERG